MRAVKYFLTVGLVAILVTAGGCETQGQSAAWGGAGLGALIGQAAGGDTQSTVVGAAAGAGVGYMIGNEKDKKAAKQEEAKREQADYTPPPNPLSGTLWTLVSINPDPQPDRRAMTVEFRPDGSVIATKTMKNGMVMVEHESYRIVGNTLIINKPGYLINAKFSLAGARLTLSDQKYGAVFHRVGK